jgi:hypothetical protein
MTILLILAVSDTIPQKSAPPRLSLREEMGIVPENKRILTVSNT